MNVASLLDHLTRQVDYLSEQFSALTPQRDILVSPHVRFDRQLFQTRSENLQDYLTEIENQLETLKKAVTQADTTKVGFLADKLLNQVSALQRELGTQSLRQQEPSRPLALDLYQRLAQHQDYERRLLSMLQDRECLLGSKHTLSEQAALQKEIAALAGRLYRCRQALQRIERSIERKESSIYFEK